MFSLMKSSAGSKVSLSQLFLLKDSESNHAAVHPFSSKKLLCFLDLLLFQEKAITPSESFLFPGTDWLIGNHSDELTPWIPVMAARQVFISRRNLTLRLKCQLISPIWNRIMCTGRMCEFVFVCLFYQAAT